VGEAREEIEHARVVGEHEGAKAMDAARLGRVEEGVEEDHPEALALESVLHHEGDLHGVGLVGGLVASHGHEVWAVLDHEGETPPIVDAGEHVRPVGRQAPHHREEALVGGVLTQPIVQLDEAGRVVGADGTKVQLRSIPQPHRTFELGGIM